MTTSDESNLVANLIGGERRPASDGATFERRDPADRRRVVSTAPESTEADVTAAVDAARDAAADWAATPAERRAALLEAAADRLVERRDELAAAMVAEMGKPIGAATVESGRTPQNLRLYAAEAIRLTGVTYPSAEPGTVVYSVRDPVGVVAVITPWNFPFNLASRKIGPALAAGNTVVFKPSPMTPRCGELLGAAFVDAGFPAGVVNVVHGDAAGRRLVADGRVAAITFTGSTATGARIHAAAGPQQRLQLELGGNNPIVVLADADVERAATVVVRSAFTLSGQACTAAGRVYVDAGLHDALVAAVVEAAGAHVLGAGSDSTTTMGPLIDDAARERVHAAVSASVDAGAHLATGGVLPADPALEHGSFYPPTVLTDVTAAMPVAAEEVFGPVIGVEPISGLDEAISRANDDPYGLTAAICTRDLDAAMHFAAHVATGTVRVNRPTVGAAFNAPFGGIKASGTGTHREQLGPTVMDFYTSLRTVMLGA